MIEHHSNSETKAVYYASDPAGAKGTFLTTLQSMISQVYQYRAMAYQKNGQWDKALDDFTTAFEYDTTVDGYINRSQLYAKMGKEEAAIFDLKRAIELDSGSYRAWYNLAIMDQTTQLPKFLMEEEEFTPMLNLVGANAFESGNYALAAQYHSRAIKADPNDDLAYLNRGKALLRTGAHSQAREDFIRVMQLEPSRTEVFYLIGNSLFYEKKFKDAVGFYERYLSIDRGYENVWFNAAMAYLSLGENEKGCEYLKNAQGLGMNQASLMLEKHCGSQ
ncbi:tetratricopeptide repeat protein [Ekhidna sp.]|uniref:tetratricopeptide repeat protein n=1 Tax=Ekhidna sp. TaxID=2608089 RepID=UPI003B593377